MNTKALRQKILDLAIHGKLVPQDPNDEPASVLLERIKAEKERLIIEGKIKRTKRSKAACDKPHYPFELPEGWCWTTIEEIGEVVTGSTPSKDIKDFYGGNIPFFKPTDLEQGIHTIRSNDRLTALGFEQSRKLPINSVLVTCIGATIGKTGLTSIEGTCNQQINAIIPTNAILPHYLYYVCISDYMQNEIKANASATTLPILNKGNFSKIFLPLPPLREQKHIIKSIVNWLSIVNSVEESKENLHEVIKQTKSKILDLAIHGKLVPQDPTDEPATELLKRINPKAEITCDNPQYENLPNGWCRCTLKDIGIFESGYAFSSDEYKQNGVPLVRISNITNNGNIDLSSCVYIQNYNNSKFIIHEGDLLIAMSGATTGKMGVYKYKTDALLNQRVGNLKCTEAWFQQYRNYFMLAKSNYILNIAYGGAQPNISAKAILSIEIDLPPINEQHRIVAKIEELFAQLNNIASSL
nr:MAG TPA: hypothetical protein [Caudoviricetes sp.]